MTKLAVIGSGPGAMYTIKYLLKRNLPNLSRVDIFEKLDTPFGLVRFGVAPDHLEVKEVANEFKGILKDYGSIARLHLNSPINTVAEFEKLRSSYDAILVATGAQSANRLPLSNLPRHTMSAQDFVLWYNGHPEYMSLDLPECPRDISIVGHGNVALDVARILSKSPAQLDLVRTHSKGDFNDHAYSWLSNRQSLPGPLSLSLIGRRGYLDAAFTNKEFRELSTMKDASCIVDPAELEPLQPSPPGLSRTKRRGLSILEKCVQNFNLEKSVKNSIFLRFFLKPVEYVSNGLRVERPNSESLIIPSDLGIESIGFKVNGNQFGLPMDPGSGGILSDEHGHVFKNVFVAGWAKRGPRGIIAANIPCCMSTAETLSKYLSK